MSLEELLDAVHARGRTLYGSAKAIEVHVYEHGGWMVSLGTITTVSEDLADALETIVRRCDRLIAQGEKDNVECDAAFERERAMAGAS